MSIKTAKALNLTKPIRIKVVWSVIETGDVCCGVTTPQVGRQCILAGGTIEAKSSTGSWTQWTTSAFPGTTPCDPTSVVSTTVGATRYAAIKARTEAAMEYWTKTLEVKPIIGGITVDQSVTSEFGVSGSFPDTDLVMIMTARPSPASPIAGFALCYQRDQRGRCTVGQFNWVPSLINTATPLDPQTTENEMHTALHELMHIIGGVGPRSGSNSMFLDPITGAPMPSSSIYKVEQDPAYNTAGKMRTLIITPSVKNKTRAHYGCDSADGMQLEDIPLGKGVHWEARVAGSELMSYGSGSGQIFISDISLAFLEDTNQYIVDYSRAGPIINASMYVDDYKTLSSLNFLTKNTAVSPYSPPDPPPAGLQRYGAGQGCSFLNVAAKSSSPRTGYNCPKQQMFTCTPDNRLSAVCVAQATWPTATNYQSCGGFDDTSGSLCITNSASKGIPPYMQYFASDAEAQSATGMSSATAAGSGGFSDAMDFQTIPVGFWSCMYPSMKSNASSAGGGDSATLVSRLTNLFATPADMAAFGGQSRCPNCRCMQSSLIELSKGGVQTSFPEYGLCYRTNCYRTDYLQVAVMGSLIELTDDYSFWYMCPPEGGKLYIPGYMGSLQCPRAVDFCKLETVSGILYPEQNRTLEVVFWGLLAGIIILIFMICTCKCCRVPVVLCMKRSCGVLVFDVPQEVDEKGERLDKPGLKFPCASRTLGIVNLLVFFAGLAIVAGASMVVFAGSTVYTVISLGLLVMLVSTFGVRASTALSESGSGPSCALLMFFLSDLVLMTCLSFTAVYIFAFADFNALIDNNFDRLTSLFSVSSICSGCSRSQQISAVKTLFQQNIAAIAGGLFAITVMLLSAFISSARMIGSRTFSSMIVVFSSYVFLVFGVFLVALAGVFASNKALTAVPSLVGMPLAAGVLFLIMSILGLTGVFRKNQCELLAFAIMQIILGMVCIACAAVCFTSKERVGAALSKLSEKDLGSVAQAVGSSTTGAKILSDIQRYLNQLGLAFAILFALQILLAVQTFYLRKFIHALGVEVDGAGSSEETSARHTPTVVRGSKAIVIKKREMSTGGATSQAPKMTPVVVSKTDPHPAQITIRKSATPQTPIEKAREVAGVGKTGMMRNVIVDV